MTTTILLVDDSRTIRLLVRAYLVGKGYEFVEATNGIEALRLVRERPPDLVICDVFMPGVGGWDFVRAVRADARPEVRRVPVILVSSKREDEVARRSAEAGANAFLTKPITGERLVETMNGLLARSTAERGEIEGNDAPISCSARGFAPDEVPPTSDVRDRSGAPSSGRTAPAAQLPPSRRGT